MTTMDRVKKARNSKEKVNMHLARIPTVSGSIPTVDRHIF